MSNGISIETHELSKTFGKFVAVDRVTFSVKAGEVFGFLGANGAGKSTTIRMLTGILLPSSGTAKVAGYDVGTQQELIRRNIGYMSQRFSLYDDLTVEENLKFYGGVYGMNPKEMTDSRNALYEKLSIGDIKDRMTGSLPLGWKQRVSLACSIQHSPKILFLDEPTGAVDPANRRKFWDLIYDLSEQGVTVFVTTHYMDEAEYCGIISIMHSGKIHAIGSPAELKEKYGLDTIEQIFIKIISEKNV